ncbi:transcriptional repressor LexA [Allorhodopirellula solitaria]|uniref:LexA repressor n=1 Tax=Allorhodopirellula solitaria TaxID=2527987 RepID=A0A5C5XNV6_9BACT|nr:transcriptional repressor LexA [Allorhodopirellula solitaria]TWT64640.1 LexA repressor [Allorhodopirellula solitaria]
MDKPQLTDRQQHVYELIRSLIQQRGYGPTVREIGEHFGIKSPNGVMCHLRALEKKGLITRKANKSRAIELTDEHARSATAMPLMGILSEHPSRRGDGPNDVIDLGKVLATEDCFVVQVSGGSFIDKGIRDGDYLIVDPNRERREGSVAVCQQAGGEVSLRVWEAALEPTVDVLGVAISMVRQSIC